MATLLTPRGRRSLGQRSPVRRGWRRAGACLLLAAALFGCSADSSPDATASGGRLAENLNELFERTLARPDIPEDAIPVIERAAASGSISTADYELVFAEYVDCLEAGGVTGLPFTKGIDGIYRLGTVNDATVTRERFAQVSVECSSTYRLVETLYNIQVNNPDLLADENEVAVRCLLRGGLVGPEYHASDFEYDRRAMTFPFEVSDPVAQSCLYAVGISIG